MANGPPFAELIGPVARLLLGEPNAKLSSKSELRYGSRGSMAIDLQNGLWFDHETGDGGGVFDLVAREAHVDVSECPTWLHEHGFDIGDDREHARKGNGADGKARSKIVKTYDYVDEYGALLFQVCRFEPKDFRQRKPDRNKPDGWSWSVKGVRRVPYRLSDLIEVLASERVVFIVEGEKDVDNLWHVGIPATTNAGGAGKWHAELSEFFRSADVVVIPDYDPQKRNPKTNEPMFHDDGRPVLPGQDHAQEIAAALVDVGARVRVLELWQHWPDMPLKGDVSDWLKAGGTADGLYALVDETPLWAPGKEAPGAPSPLRILTKADFIKDFRPPDYLIEGLLQRRFVYSLTGVTGHAKSAIALLLSELVSSNRTTWLGSHRVEQGRVAYFVGENPDDIRMRVIGADSKRPDDEQPLRDNIVFIPGIFDIGAMFTTLHQRLGKLGSFDLIIVDTSAAYFLGNEELSNTQMGAHARMLRRLTELPGGPCVLVLSHPIKHAVEPTQLLPRGGGAFLAEMDGNFTAWKHDEVLVQLHYTKLRGPGFEPLTFRLETIRTERLVDNKGRSIPTVRAVAISQSEEDQQQRNIHSDDEHVLAARLRYGDDQQVSIADLATACGWTFGDGSPAKSRVQKALERLEKAKPAALAYRDRGRWLLTEKGKDAARKVTLRLAQEERSNHTRQMAMDLT